MRSIFRLLAVASFLLFTSSVAAQTWPGKPITLLVPVTPGGGMDSVARILSLKLGEALGQPVVVENKPGAGGNIASAAVAAAAPDGYVLGMVAAGLATNVSLYKSLPYDPVRSFAPISQLSAQPYVLVINPALPIRDLPQFIGYAKARTGGINYGSAGTGLLGHLSMELLKSMAGFEATHIPYRGASPAMVDVVGGRIDAFFSTITSALPQLRSNRVRAIAVTSPTRHPLLPDVPTVAEQGFPSYEVISWYGLVAPAGTPSDRIDRLQEAVGKVLASEEVRTHMANDGAVPVSSSPAAFGSYIRQEIERWAKVIKESGATAD